MKNRKHIPKETKTLRQICAEGKILFPITDETNILIETGCSRQTEAIFRNFPDRSYSTKSEDPKVVVELLAYEAHEWQAWEIVRTTNKHKFPLLT